MIFKNSTNTREAFVWVWNEYLANGQLQSVLDHYQLPDTGVWTDYPQQRYLAAKVRLFIDFLVENLRRRL